MAGTKVGKDRADGRTAPSWLARHRAQWPLLLLCGALVFLYAPVLARLVTQWWQDANYSHGFLVPLFVGFVVWERRSTLAAVPARPSWWGALVVLFALALLFLGSLGAELFLARFSLLVMVTGLLLWLHGWPLVRSLKFPLAALLLMIPIPGVVYYELVFPLQMLASRLAAGALQASHLMPVLRDGNVLVLPSTRLEVAEACSGIRSLVSLLTITVIYGYFGEKRASIRWLLCLFMVPIAVLSNAARVVFSAVAAEYGGVAALEGWPHTLSGIFLFLVATMLLVAAHLLLRSVYRRFGAKEQAA